MARGLCRKHYAQNWSNKTITSFAKVDPLDAFVNRIQKTESCWIWTGKVNQSGYGMFCLAGDRPIRAHRHAFMLWNGELQRHEIVMHTCDNPRCVNPEHLKKGTRADNNKDCTDKGRRPKGVNHWNNKLTDEQVASIRTNSRKQSILAKEYGVHQSTISKIKSMERR